MISRKELHKRKIKLGSKLYQAREEAKISQSELQRQGIIRQSQLSKIENGELLPNIFMLAELAEIYGKNLDYFIKD